MQNISAVTAITFPAGILYGRSSRGSHLRSRITAIQAIPHPITNQEEESTLRMSRTPAPKNGPMTIVTATNRFAT